MEKVDQFDRIWVLQAELGLFSSGAPSSEHAVGAPGDSCAMTSNQPHLELMEKSRSNAKLIKKQQIFVYLLTGKKKRKNPAPNSSKASLWKMSQWFQKACPKPSYSNGIYNM